MSNDPTLDPQQQQEEIRRFLELRKKLEALIAQGPQARASEYGLAESADPAGWLQETKARLQKLGVEGDVPYPRKRGTPTPPYPRNIPASTPWIEPAFEPAHEASGDPRSPDFVGPEVPGKEVDRIPKRPLWKRALGIGRNESFGDWVESGETAGRQAAKANRGLIGLAGAVGSSDFGDSVGLGVQAAAGDPTAIAELARKKVERIGKHVGGAIQGVTDDRADKVASNVFGAGSELSDLAGPIGMQAKPFLALGEAVFKSIEKLRDWTDGLHKSNMQFAEFSAAMARVQAETDVRRIRYEQRRGDARAETARELSEARDRLSRAFAPYEDAFKNFANSIGGAALSKIAEALEYIARRFGLKEDKDEGTTGGLFGNIVDAGRGEWTKTYGRPGRFP